MPPTSKKEDGAPARFVLADVERLELENIELSRQLLQHRFDRWAERVGKAHGVSLGQYTINSGTGEATLQGHNPGPIDVEFSDAEID